MVFKTRCPLVVIQLTETTTTNNFGFVDRPGKLNLLQNTFFLCPQRLASSLLVHYGHLPSDTYIQRHFFKSFISYSHTAELSWARTTWSTRHFSTPSTYIQTRLAQVTADSLRKSGDQLFYNMVVTRHCQMCILTPRLEPVSNLTRVSTNYK